MTHLRAHRAAARTQAGLTLVELMVALTIGLIMIGAIGTLFIGSSGARREVQSSADAFENARYAVDLLNRELAQAGFHGTWTANLNVTDLLGAPCMNPDVGVAHVFGWNQGQGDATCLADRKAGTDAIFVQRASTCEAGIGGCTAVQTTRAYLQVAECNPSGGSLPPPKLERGDAAGVANFTHKAKNCTASAPLREVIRRVYYVNQDDVLGYLEIRPGGNVTVPLVENIDQLQLAYAIDDFPADRDGSPDKFEPASAVTAAEWADVVGVRVWLVARSEGESDRRPSGLSQSFELDDMPADGLDLTKAYRRSVSSSYISFVSPTLRRAN